VDILPAWLALNKCSANAVYLFKGAERKTENSASTAVCLSKADAGGGASFRSQVFFGSFLLSQKGTRKHENE
jgi:hypothetical protein